MATEDQLARLHSVVPAAQAAQKKYGVPASVTLAQWIFESSWGTSKLSTTANNFFGIKARQTQIPTSYVEFPTAEYENGERIIVDALFEKYPSEAAGFDAHAALLATAPRYRYAMLHTASPEEFAACLQTAGYSTNPQYAHSLVQAMCDYNLFQFDPWPDGPAKAQEVAA
jgi:flagellum-specific peptidoglycan hydrolase FlgJ